MGGGQEHAQKSRNARHLNDNAQHVSSASRTSRRSTGWASETAARGGTIIPQDDKAGWAGHGELRSAMFEFHTWERILYMEGLGVRGEAKSESDPPCFLKSGVLRAASCFLEVAWLCEVVSQEYLQDAGEGAQLEDRRCEYVPHLGERSQCHWDIQHADIGDAAAGQSWQLRNARRQAARRDYEEERKVSLL